MKNSEFSFESKRKGLTLTAPRGALCGLYPEMPKSRNYFEAIEESLAIVPTRVSSGEETDVYYYEGLATGLYHAAASKDGYYAFCQIINYTQEKADSGFQLNINLDKMAGSYEDNCLILYSEEFIASHMQSEKNTWGEKYARLFRTPQFLRPEGRVGKHQQTTSEELYAFIDKLNEKCDFMHVFSLGKSPKYNLDMPLVLFTRENVAGKTLEEAAEIIRTNGKLTVQYTAQVHGNEPASAEGALAMMLELTEDYGKSVLDTVDIYIVPRINLDGAVESIRESPTTGDDMNRDYLYMNNAEIRMVTSAYNLFLPEIAIDAHEKTAKVLSEGESDCTDMELQVGAGSLNHPAIMTKTAMDIALSALSRAKDLGLRGHFFQRFASAAGGSAGSSYYGTRNSLSFLVETPGLRSFCMSFIERRVMAQYVFASTVINYAVEHSGEIMSIVHSSRKLMAEKGPIYDESDIMTLEHEKAETSAFPSPIINITTGEVIEPEHFIPYTEHVIALHTRVRAAAYVIPKGLKNEEEILRVAKCHAIGYYEIPEGSAVSLCGYIKGDEKIELDEERSVKFEKGAYVFPNTVPSTILNVIMEPDFNSVSGRKMSLHSMHLIATDESGRLPIYRYCHNLINGKVTLD